MKKDKKGRFQYDEKPNNTKVTQVLPEDDTVGMIITRDDTRIISVTGETGQTDNPQKDLGIDFNHPPADSVFYTHTNPTCGYYYWNGRWYYR